MTKGEQARLMAWRLRVLQRAPDSHIASEGRDLRRAAKRELMRLADPSCAAVAEVSSVLMNPQDVRITERRLPTE